MSFGVRLRQSATWLSPLVVLIVLVLVAACGSDKKSSSTLDQATGDSNSSDGNSITAVKNSAYSTKMARQTTDDIQEQADLSEAASTGSSDGGGVEAPEQHGHKHGFDMSMSPNTDFNNVAVGFQGNITLTGSRMNGADVHGGCGLSVAPQQPGHAPGPQGQQNFTIVLTSDVTRTLDNNDTIEVKTEPNVTISRMGSRQSGTITRLINGQVHRTLTSTTDPNNDFNITLNHNGHIVVDTYDVGPSYLLKSRVINGVSTVTDAGRGITSQVTFAGVTRGQPTKCFCPTSGTITQIVTQSGQTTTHSYVFSGSCGASTVSIDGSAAVAAAANSNTTVKARSGGETETENEAGVSSSAAIDVHGALTWESCVPTAADLAAN